MMAEIKLFGDGNLLNLGIGIRSLEVVTFCVHYFTKTNGEYTSPLAGSLK